MEVLPILSSSACVKMLTSILKIISHV